ncbi:MAG TPA: hypothetical protein VIF40_09975 [Methylosinus sp.]|uniref:hypothetical protein n=1 Tax=Methylosinus sp. TaxID=427 RepID=UPI002F941D85
MRDIENEVLAVLRTLTPSGAEIERSSRIIEDLALLSDDATAMALDLERRLKIRAPRTEWARVATVADVIELLRRNIER